MELRRRVKPSKLDGNAGIVQETPAEGGRCSGEARGPDQGQSTGEGGGPGKAPLLRGSGTCSGSGILSRWPWRQWVSIAAGLLLAALLALAQAWSVNAIHENLLWFSQLTVGVLVLFSFQPFVKQQGVVCVQWESAGDTNKPHAV